MHFTKKQNNVQALQFYTFAQSYFSVDNTFFKKSSLDFLRKKHSRKSQ